MALIAYTYIDIDVNRLYDDVALIIAKQNDSGRGICATLYSDGELLDPTGVTCQIYILKPDGTKVYQQFTVSNKRIYITLSNNTLAVPGICKAEIRYTLGNNMVTTPIFNIAVYPTNIDNSAIESQDEFTALEQAISTLSNYDSRLSTVETKANTNASDISSLKSWKNIAGETLDNLNKSMSNFNLLNWPLYEIQGAGIVKNNIRTRVKSYVYDNADNAFYGVEFYTNSSIDISDTIFYLTENYVHFPSGEYTLSGNPGGGKNSDGSRKWGLAASVKHSDGSTNAHLDDGEGVTFSLSDTDTVRFYIKFYAAGFSGPVTLSTGYFKPMFEIGSTKSPYVPQLNITENAALNSLRAVDIIASEFFKTRNMISNTNSHIKLTESNVNLLEWPMDYIKPTAQAKNDIIPTVHSTPVTDGYYGVSFKKTSTANIQDTEFSLTDSNFSLPGGTYTLSGLIGSNKNSDGQRMWTLAANVRHSDGTNTVYHADNASGVTFNLLSNDTVHIYIKFYAASFGSTKTFETSTFKPKLEVGDRATGYALNLKRSTLTTHGTSNAEVLSSAIISLLTTINELGLDLTTLTGRVVALEHKVG